MVGWWVVMIYFQPAGYGNYLFYLSRLKMNQPKPPRVYKLLTAR